MSAADNEQVVAAILAHPRLADAAAALGVDYSTLWRRMQEEPVRALLAEARRDLLRHAVGSLQAAMGEAVETLRGILSDPEARASAKVAAARCILETGFRGSELIEFEARLAALEAKLSGKETRQ